MSHVGGLLGMIDILQEILQVYREYIGTGMLGALFFAAVFYLGFEEKVPERKLVFVIVPVILTGLFGCPVFAWFVNKYLEEEIYYRFLWLLPVVAVTSYAGVRLVLRVSGAGRIWAFLGVCGIIMVCGDYVYDNPYFERAENLYHVPQTVAEICDEIIVEGREVRAVFPGEMVQYVRQYTPFVCMPYGREMIVERWRIASEMYEVYELGLPDGIVRAKTLAETARKYEVHYIIWDTGRDMSGDLRTQDFVLVDVIDGYAIYRDELANLGIPVSGSGQ